MGKTKSNKKYGHHVSRPGALEDQILKDKYAKPSSRTKREKSASTNKKAVNLNGVLSQLRELQEEKADDELKKTTKGEEEEEEEEFEMPEYPEALTTNFQTEMNIKLNNEEQELYAAFMSSTKREKTCIAKMRETLFEQHEEIKTQIDEESNAGGPAFSEEVLKMFDDAAYVLREYRSGAIPKMLKVMPRLRNWIHLLYRTKPEEWSAAAMFMLTKIFSHQSAEMAQVFYCKVLLPRLRDDIAQYKRLNAHLYRAVGVALFKSAAFFKGLIFPLCMDNDCTLREAVIFGSLLAKKSIPLSAAAAAMRVIAGLKYNGANSIFLSVIDDLCAHFVRCKFEDKKLPVLWHQSLLAFVQRYKEDLSKDQKEQLSALAAFHSHKDITPEVRRELDNSKCRNDK